MKKTKRMKILSSILLSIFLFLLAGCSGTLPPILSPPTGVSASDASYTDIVQITWDTVSGASHYQGSTGLILFWEPRWLSPAGRQVLPILILAPPHGSPIITGLKLRPAVAGIMSLDSVARTQVMLF